MNAFNTHQYTSVKIVNDTKIIAEAATSDDVSSETSELVTVGKISGKSSTFKPKTVDVKEAGAIREASILSSTMSSSADAISTPSTLAAKLGGFNFSFFQNYFV